LNINLLHPFIFALFSYTLIMATIQSKKSRGHKYWYIVESRRVNGKPRPVVLSYLGKADDLLKRLQELYELKLKSYSHGAVCALIDVAAKLDIVNILNKYVKSSRHYIAEKPVRNHLTIGITLLLGAVGRVCMPTSKMGWWNWARTTSVEYLLRCSLSKVDSQHFWDLMDSFPEDAIASAEQEILTAYYGQSKIEHAFKNLKNPYHLAWKPQYHWTDQKIKVHYFICTIGYLLLSIIWREAKLKAGYTGTLDNLFFNFTSPGDLI